MRRTAIALLAWSLLWTGYSGRAVARALEPLLDSPLRTVHIALPRDPENPDAKPQLRCTYYRRFVVKEIDLGEVGAWQLSVLPANGQERTCRRANAPDEAIVSQDDWTGYFKGAAGDYILFDAEDGWNGGLGFAVFTPRAKKLFDDVAKRWGSITRTAAPSGPALVLRYLRVYGAKCSLGNRNAPACWKTIERETGLDAPMPDCGALYRREQRRTPELAKEVLDDPAAVDYSVVTTLTPNGPRIVPLPGELPTCRPQD
jgi:hypothetical protein